MTLEWTNLRCPVCATTFETIAVVRNETHSAGSIETTPEYMAIAMLPFLIHVCRRCGYAGDVEAFAKDVKIPRDVRARVWAELAPKLAPSVRIPAMLLTAPGSEKHEGAAKVAEWRRAKALTIAELWIRAARCAIDEDDLEAERYYARFAARWFAEALERNEVALQERASIIYGLGELWLHLGDVRRANCWFQRVPAEVPEGSKAQPLEE